jgi:hypothetical protein
MRSRPRVGRLSSIAIVAFGRDHDAAIDLRIVGFY